MKIKKTALFLVECTKDEVLMLNGCLSEIHELYCYELHVPESRFDFEKEIGLTLPETDALRSQIGTSFELGKAQSTVWHFQFCDKELSAILRSIEKLVSPKSPLYWELGIRTGFDPEEYSLLGNEIRAALAAADNEHRLEDI